jgi:hypothetical protein
MRRLLIIGTFVLVCVRAAAASVVFVDADHAGGAGTFEKPFATIAEGQRGAGMAGVIFVAEASKAYEENVALTKGQMLIGSAYGLDAVRDELHVSINARPSPAAQGTGPVIHGNVSLAGDNVVAGCMITADKKTGAGLTAETPQGPLTIRKLWIQTTGDVYGFYVGHSAFPTAWTVGGLTAADGGSGLLIEGGQGNVTLDHVAIGGAFASGIEIRNRTGGTVAFRNASSVKISDVTRAGVSITACTGAVRFESPLQVKTTGGRGFVVNLAGTVAVIGGSSWIEAVNGTALDVRAATTDIVLQHVSASGIAPGKVTDAIVIDKVRGRFEITGEETLAGSGGAVVNALSYGLRVAQSTGVRIRNMIFTGGGTVAAQDECPQDIPKQTNVRCRAALYLRHVEGSTFENIAIDGNAGIGLNANNIIDVSFRDVHIANTGDQRSEPAVLIDEARGTISFTLCSILDGGGGGIGIEQRFNSARIVFERCDVSAPKRPAAAEALIRADVAGGRLGLELVNSQVHENAGSAIRVTARENGTLDLIVRDSGFNRFGSTAIDASAAGNGKLSVELNGVHIATPAVLGEPLVAMRLLDSAVGCFAADANEFIGGSPSATLSSRGASKLSVGGDPAAFGTRNGGGTLVIEGSATLVTGSCHGPA